MLSVEELRTLGNEGIIAAPKESEEEFVNRLDILKKAKEALSQGRTFEKWSPDYHQILGAKPQWIPLTYSSRGLLPWQGAAMWVFAGSGSEKIPMIQLRKGFKKGKFLFYSKDEVLMHETLHAIRVGFDEPRFEEILAYYHSKSRWRHFFGPLFRKPSHALVFISLILVSLMAQASAFFYLPSPIDSYLKILTLLPLFDLIFKSALLIKDQRLLKKALEKISNIFPKEKNAFPIAIRLKDSEIQNFAIKSEEEILQLIEKEIPYSVRWRQILAQFC